MWEPEQALEQGLVLVWEQKQEQELELELELPQVGPLAEVGLEVGAICHQCQLRLSLLLRLRIKLGSPTQQVSNI